MIGVAAQGFHPQGPNEVGIYLPFAVDENTGVDLWGIARLKDGVSLRAAQAEMSAISRQVAEANLFPVLERRVGDVCSILLLLFAAVGTVLLIACANIGSLLLARWSFRSHEMALPAVARRALQ